MKRYIAFLLFLICIIFLIGREIGREKSEKTGLVNDGKCLICDNKGVITCAMCKGSGRYGEKKSECPGCHGDGETRCVCSSETLMNDDEDDDILASDDDENRYSSNKNEEKKELCTLCRGNKKVDCTTCDGNGTYYLAGIKVLCMTCGGNQKTDCLGCGGTGYKLKFDNDNNSNAVVNPDIDDIFDNNVGGNYPSSCARCKNRGVITCTGCGGDGKIPKTQYAPDFGAGGGMNESYTTCRTCGGNKIIDCPNC